LTEERKTVHVTAVQVAAAKLAVQLSEERGKPVDPAVRRIAEAKRQ